MKTINETEQMVIAVASYSTIEGNKEIYINSWSYFDKFDFEAQSNRFGFLRFEYKTVVSRAKKKELKKKYAAARRMGLSFEEACQQLCDEQQKILSINQ